MRAKYKITSREKLLRDSTREFLIEERRRCEIDRFIIDFRILIHKKPHENHNYLNQLLQDYTTIFLSHEKMSVNKNNEDQMKYQLRKQMTSRRKDSPKQRYVKSKLQSETDKNFEHISYSALKAETAEFLKKLREYDSLEQLAHEIFTTNSKEKYISDEYIPKFKMNIPIEIPYTKHYRNINIVNYDSKSSAKSRNVNILKEISSKSTQGNPNKNPFGNHDCSQSDAAKYVHHIQNDEGLENVGKVGRFSEIPVEPTATPTKKKSLLSRIKNIMRISSENPTELFKQNDNQQTIIVETEFFLKNEKKFNNFEFEAFKLFQIKSGEIQHPLIETIEEIAYNKLPEHRINVKNPKLLIPEKSSEKEKFENFNTVKCSLISSCDKPFKGDDISIAVNTVPENMELHSRKPYLELERKTFLQLFEMQRSIEREKFHILREKTRQFLLSQKLYTYQQKKDNDLFEEKHIEQLSKQSTRKNALLTKLRLLLTFGKTNKKEKMLYVKQVTEDFLKSEREFNSPGIYAFQIYGKIPRLSSGNQYRHFESGTEPTVVSTIGRNPGKIRSIKRRSKSEDQLLHRTKSNSLEIRSRKSSNDQKSFSDRMKSMVGINKTFDTEKFKENNHKFQSSENVLHIESKRYSPSEKVNKRVRKKDRPEIHERKKRSRTLSPAQRLVYTFRNILNEESKKKENFEILIRETENFMKDNKQFNDAQTESNHVRKTGSELDLQSRSIPYNAGNNKLSDVSSSENEDKLIISRSNGESSSKPFNTEECKKMISVVELQKSSLQTETVHNLILSELQSDKKNGNHAYKEQFIKKKTENFEGKQISYPLDVSSVDCNSILDKYKDTSRRIHVEGISNQTDNLQNKESYPSKEMSSAPLSESEKIADRPMPSAEIKQSSDYTKIIGAKTEITNQTQNTQRSPLKTKTGTTTVGTKDSSRDKFSVSPLKHKKDNFLRDHQETHNRLEDEHNQFLQKPQNLELDKLMNTKSAKESQDSKVKNIFFSHNSKKISLPRIHQENNIILDQTRKFLLENQYVIYENEILHERLNAIRLMQPVEVASVKMAKTCEITKQKAKEDRDHDSLTTSQNEVAIDSKALALLQQRTNIFLKKHREYHEIERLEYCKFLQTKNIPVSKVWTDPTFTIKGNTLMSKVENILSSHHSKKVISPNNQKHNQSISNKTQETFQKHEYLNHKEEISFKENNPLKTTEVKTNHLLLSKDIDIQKKNSPTGQKDSKKHKTTRIKSFLRVPYKKSKDRVGNHLMKMQTDEFLSKLRYFEILEQEAFSKSKIKWMSDEPSYFPLISNAEQSNNRKAFAELKRKTEDFLRENQIYNENQRVDEINFVHKYNIPHSKFWFAPKIRTENIVTKLRRLLSPNHPEKSSFSEDEQKNGLILDQTEGFLDKHQYTIQKEEINFNKRKSADHVLIVENNIVAETTATPPCTPVEKAQMKKSTSTKRKSFLSVNNEKCVDELHDRKIRMLTGEFLNQLKRFDEQILRSKSHVVWICDQLPESHKQPTDELYNKKMRIFTQEFLNKLRDFQCVNQEIISKCNIEWMSEKFPKSDKNQISDKNLNITEPFLLLKQKTDSFLKEHTEYHDTQRMEHNTFLQKQAKPESEVWMVPKIVKEKQNIVTKVKKLLSSRHAKKSIVPNVGRENQAILRQTQKFLEEQNYIIYEDEMICKNINYPEATIHVLDSEAHPEEMKLEKTTLPNLKSLPTGTAEKLTVKPYAYLLKTQTKEFLKRLKRYEASEQEIMSNSNIKWLDKVISVPNMKTLSTTDTLPSIETAELALIKQTTEKFLTEQKNYDDVQRVELNKFIQKYDRPNSKVWLTQDSTKRKQNIVTKVKNFISLHHSRKPNDPDTQKENGMIRDLTHKFLLNQQYFIHKDENIIEEPNDPEPTVIVSQISFSSGCPQLLQSPEKENKESRSVINNMRTYLGSRKTTKHTTDQNYVHLMKDQTKAFIEKLRDFESIEQKVSSRSKIKWLSEQACIPKITHDFPSRFYDEEKPTNFEALSFLKQTTRSFIKEHLEYHNSERIEYNKFLQIRGKSQLEDWLSLKLIEEKSNIFSKFRKPLSPRHSKKSVLLDDQKKNRILEDLTQASHQTSQYLIYDEIIPKKLIRICPLGSDSGNHGFFSVATAESEGGAYAFAIIKQNTDDFLREHKEYHENERMEHHNFLQAYGIRNTDFWLTTKETKEKHSILARVKKLISYAQSKKSNSPISQMEAEFIQEQTKEFLRMHQYLIHKDEVNFKQSNLVILAEKDPKNPVKKSVATSLRSLPKGDKMQKSTLSKMRYMLNRRHKQPTDELYNKDMRTKTEKFLSKLRNIECVEQKSLSESNVVWMTGKVKISKTKQIPEENINVSQAFISIQQETNNFLIELKKYHDTQRIEHNKFLQKQRKPESEVWMKKEQNIVTKVKNLLSPRHAEKSTATNVGKGIQAILEQTQKFLEGQKYFIYEDELLCENMNNLKATVHIPDSKSQSSEKKGEGTTLSKLKSFLPGFTKQPTYVTQTHLLKFQTREFLRRLQNFEMKEQEALSMGKNEECSNPKTNVLSTTLRQASLDAEEFAIIKHRTGNFLENHKKFEEKQRFEYNNFIKKYDGPNFEVRLTPESTNGSNSILTKFKNFMSPHHLKKPNVLDSRIEDLMNRDFTHEFLINEQYFIDKGKTIVGNPKDREPTEQLSETTVSTSGCPELSQSPQKKAKGNKKMMNELGTFPACTNTTKQTIHRNDGHLIKVQTRELLAKLRDFEGMEQEALSKFEIARITEKSGRTEISSIPSLIPKEHINTAAEFIMMKQKTDELLENHKAFHDNILEKRSNSESEVCLIPEITEKRQKKTLMSKIKHVLSNPKPSTQTAVFYEDVCDASRFNESSSPANHVKEAKTQTFKNEVTFFDENQSVQPSEIDNDIETYRKLKNETQEFLQDQRQFQQKQCNQYLNFESNEDIKHTSTQNLAKSRKPKALPRNIKSGDDSANFCLEKTEGTHRTTTSQRNFAVFPSLEKQSLDDKHLKIGILTNENPQISSLSKKSYKQDAPINNDMTTEKDNLLASQYGTSKTSTEDFLNSQREYMDSDSETWPKCVKFKPVLLTENCGKQNSNKEMNANVRSRKEFQKESKKSQSDISNRKPEYPIENFKLIREKTNLFLNDHKNYHNKEKTYIDNSIDMNFSVKPMKKTRTKKGMISKIKDLVGGNVKKTMRIEYDVVKQQNEHFLGDQKRYSNLAKAEEDYYNSKEKFVIHELEASPTSYSRRKIVRSFTQNDDESSRKKIVENRVGLIGDREIDSSAPLTAEFVDKKADANLTKKYEKENDEFLNIQNNRNNQKKVFATQRIHSHGFLLNERKFMELELLLMEPPNGEKFVERQERNFNRTVEGDELNNRSLEDDIISETTKLQCLQNENPDAGRLKMRIPSLSTIYTEQTDIYGKRKNGESLIKGVVSAVSPTKTIFKEIRSRECSSDRKIFIFSEGCTIDKRVNRNDDIKSNEVVEGNEGTSGSDMNGRVADKNLTSLGSSVTCTAKYFRNGIPDIMRFLNEERGHDATIYTEGHSNEKKISAQKRPEGSLEVRRQHNQRRTYREMEIDPFSVVTESRVMQNGAKNQKYVTSCYFHQLPTPIWFTESLLVDLEEKKQKFSEKVYYDNQFQPNHWSEMFITNMELKKTTYISEATIDIKQDSEDVHYISLESQQERAENGYYKKVENIK